MTTRITGLVSGLDVDSLVTAGCTLIQSKLDKANQAEQTTEWKQEQYQTIESDVTDFYNKYLDTTSTDCLANSSIWNTKTYTSNNESAVTVTAASDATAELDNYTINVTQLAKAATTTLKTPADYVNGLSVTIGGTTVSINPSSDITGYDTMLDKEKATAVATAFNKKLSDAKCGMTATYSEFSGGIVLETDALGSNASFTTTLTNSSSVATTSATPIKGTNLNATITSSSGTYTIGDSTDATANNKEDYASNSIALDGITFSFKDTTTTAAKVTGTNDVSDVQDKIESFVNDYNTLIKSINEKVYEEHDSDYPPLTDAQKNDMSETEIKNWETKAQVGLLHNDSYLQKLASDMKDTMTSLISSTGVDLESIGIKPVQNYSTKNGTFEITSATLKKALEGTLTAHGKTVTLDGVKALFMNGVDKTTSFTTSLTTSQSSSYGILARLRVALNANVCNTDSALTDYAGNDEYPGNATTNELYMYLKEQTTLIATLKDQLEDKEDSLYSKYSTLDTNLSSLKATSSIFSSSSSS